MQYVTLADLARTIRENFHKVPHDIDFVLGVPRSGMICASIVSEFLNVPLTDVDSFCFGAEPTGGGRLRFHTPSGREKPRVLVLDDTIFHGRSMEKTRKKLAPIAGQYEFIYAVVYLEGPCASVDLWLEDLRPYTENFTSFVLYEWNIMHHTTRHMERCIFDIDGVLCVDPPDERDTQSYLNYIANATPLFVPSNPIGEIVSYRLREYEDVTKRWLADYGIRYGALTMFPAKSYDERRASRISPAAFKADIYRCRSWAVLFIESDDAQSRQIADMARRPVYCVKTNTIYR